MGGYACWVRCGGGGGVGGWLGVRAGCACWVPIAKGRGNVSSEVGIDGAEGWSVGLLSLTHFRGGGKNGKERMQVLHIWVQEYVIMIIDCGSVDGEATWASRNSLHARLQHYC